MTMSSLSPVCGVASCHSVDETQSCSETLIKSGVPTGECVEGKLQVFRSRVGQCLQALFEDPQQDFIISTPYGSMSARMPTRFAVRSLIKHCLWRLKQQEIILAPIFGARLLTKSGTVHRPSTKLSELGDQDELVLFLCQQKIGIGTNCGCSLSSLCKQCQNSPIAFESNRKQVDTLGGRRCQVRFSEHVDFDEAE